MVKKSALRSLLCALVIVSLLCSCGGSKGGFRLPAPPANGYVLDVAGVLKPETTEHILAQDEALFAAVGGAVSVVTLDVLGGKDIAEYANRLYADWGLDSRGQKNSVLLLLAVDEGQYWLIQGEGIGKDLTEEALKDLAWRYLEHDFAVGSYDAGVRKLFDALLGWYTEFYALAPQEEAPAEEESPAAPAKSEGKGGAFPVWLVVLLVAAAAAVGALWLRGRPRQSRSRRRRRSSYPRGRRGR